MSAKPVSQKRIILKDDFPATPVNSAGIFYMKPLPPKHIAANTKKEEGRMCLYYENKQSTSYITSSHIIAMINRALGKGAIELRPEDGGSDALLYGIPVEMKQRQNTYFVDVFEGRQRPHKETTIHKSATTHGSQIYIIYDLGLRYAQIFVASDINEYDRSFDRRENTEVGNRTIRYSTVDTAKTQFVDLLDKRQTREALNRAVAKVEEKNALA